MCKKVTVKAGDKILFMGDSITDSGRDYADEYGLTGYNRIACAQLPGVTGYNRGINGNTCRQMLDRLGDECEKIRPNVISILAGINDTGRRPDGYFADAEEFDYVYRELLKTAFSYTDRVIVMEPFLIRKDAGFDGVVPKLFERIAAVRRIADGFGCVYIPLDGLFASAWIAQNGAKYSVDCVHLTQEGKQFVADEWLRRIEYKS